MPTTRDIRRRIKSVRTRPNHQGDADGGGGQNAQGPAGALGGRPYAALMNEVLAEATARAGISGIRSWKPRSAKAGDHPGEHGRGLCGALNSNLFREAVKFDRTRPSTSRRDARRRNSSAYETAAGGGVHLQGHAAIWRGAGDFQIRAGPVYQREVDAVDVLFANYVSTLVQRPEIVHFCRWEKSRRSPPAFTARRKRGIAAGGDVPICLSRMRRRCWANCCRTV